MHYPFRCPCGREETLNLDQGADNLLEQVCPCPSKETMKRVFTPFSFKVSFREGTDPATEKYYNTQRERDADYQRQGLVLREPTTV